MSFSVGSSLTIAFVLICLARSAEIYSFAYFFFSFTFLSGSALHYFCIFPNFFLISGSLFFVDLIKCELPYLNVEKLSS